MIATSAATQRYTPATRPAAGLAFGAVTSVGLGIGAAAMSSASSTRVKAGAAAAAVAFGAAGTLLGVYGSPSATNTLPIALPIAGALAGAAAMTIPALRHNTGIGHALGSIVMLPVGAGLGAVAGFGAAMGMTLVGMGAFGLAGRHAQHA